MFYIYIEAIKFGDPLNIEECTLLIQALQDTKAPTRCAHGRPSIIPLMDLSDLEKRKINTNVSMIFIIY
jgi:DNA mismatch repair ATPase MutL